MLLLDRVGWEINRWFEAPWAIVCLILESWMWLRIWYLSLFEGTFLRDLRRARFLILFLAFEAFCIFYFFQIVDCILNIKSDCRHWFESWLFRLEILSKRRLHVLTYGRDKWGTWLLFELIVRIKISCCFRAFELRLFLSIHPILIKRWQYDLVDILSDVLEFFCIGWPCN